jgi:hypothetical protein
MAGRKDISEELQEISPVVARLTPVNPYHLPERYFDNLADIILLRLKDLEEESAVDEIAMLSPLLSGLNKKMPFTTPEGYFEQLSPKAPIMEKKEGRIIQMPFKRVVRLAAAACITAIIAAAAWVYFGQSTDNRNNTLAQKNDSSAQKELIEKVHTISDKEIADFVEGDPSQVTDDPGSSSDQIKEEDIKLMLADVSDKELENFLTENISKKEKYN